uniref:glutathione transferase n=1 Tax=Brachionus rotundiformis TaxID=96890 RepID=A0A3G2JSF2_9BILA|nr:glutathione S-transferase S10 [Brachionus rotundiformis]
MSDYNLVYFNLRARGEIIRLIFAASGKQYNEERVEFEEWPARKNQAPLGQLPYLKVGSVELPQSMAIARFVARETGLAGKNNLQQAQADAIVDTIMELVNYYYSNIFRIKDEDEKAEAFSQFLEKQATNGAKNVEKLVGMYGSNGYSVGDSLTWADLAIYDVIYSLLRKEATFMDKFPVLNKIYSNVNTNSGVADYVKKRPETPF